MKVKLSRRAGADLDDILDYLSGHDPLAAVAFTEELDRRIALLRTQPWMGRRTSAPDIFEIVLLRTYLLPYTVDGDTIEILRVFHHARDPASK